MGSLFASNLSSFYEQQKAAVVPEIMGNKEGHRNEQLRDYEGPAHILHGRADSTEKKSGNKQKLRSFRKWLKKARGPMAIYTLFIALGASLQCGSSILQSFVMSRQLGEMRSGSGDTHQLAVAATKQADAAKAQSENMAALAQATKTQSENTAALAKATKAQSDNTAALVRAARDQIAKLESEITAIRQQTEAYERPWLKVAVSLTEYWADRNTFIFKASITNAGHSVANSISVRSRLIALPYAGSGGVALEPLWAQQSLCGVPPKSNMKRDPSEPQSASVFPTESAEIPFGASLSEKDIAYGRLPSPNMATIWIIRPVLIGCVDYLFPNATEYHQTGFIYVIEQLDSSGGRAPIQVGKEVRHASALVLNKYSPAADYAY